MDDKKKKQRRVSFASEAPEQNVYEKEMTINSFTTDDVTADFTCEQTKIGKSFYEIAKEEDKENDSLMSNNTAVFGELVDTQYIRTIVPEQKKVQVNINELLMEHGIRFLDDIVISSTRRETLSKSKKEVDPRNIVYYKHFLSHRIKFFEDFSDDLKTELIKLSDELKKVEMNFDIKNTLLEKEDKSKLRSLKTDCRNRSTVSWYELRAKKELDFNDFIIKVKSELISEFNEKENALLQIRSQKQELEEELKSVEEKLQNINLQDINNITTQSLDKLRRDILSHEQVLEEYSTEHEKLRIDVNNKLISDKNNETKYLKIKNEIDELEKQFKAVNVNENDLNDAKFEYEKITAIFGLEILEYKQNYCVFKFLNFKLSLDRNFSTNIGDVYKLLNIQYSGIKSIIHEYGVIITKQKTEIQLLDTMRFLFTLYELYKEVLLLSINNSIDVFIEKDELHILIVVNNIHKLERYKIKSKVKPTLEILIETRGESYLYNLYEDKGCILGHIE